MALNDLISQAKKSKLGRAISNVVSRADRDKDMAGFQIVPGGVRGGVERVKQSFRNDPGQYSITRGFSNIVPTTQAVLSPINYLKRQAPSQFAQDVSYGLRGASQFTPFQAVNSLGLDKRGQQQYQSTAPTTDRQRTAQQVGRTLYGSALSAPIGGASKAINVARNIATPTIAGAVLSPALMTAGKFLTQRETPTGEELLQATKQGAFQGFKSAPVLAFTNPITSKIVGTYVNYMGGSGLTNQVLQRSIGALANTFEDEVIAKTDGITPTNHERLLSLALGALFTGNNFKQFEVEAKASGVPQSSIDAIKKQARSEVTGRYIQKGTQEQLAPRVYANGNIEDPNLTLKPRIGGRGFELQRNARSRLNREGGFVDFGAKIGTTKQTPQIEAQKGMGKESTLSKVSGSLESQKPIQSIRSYQATPQGLKIKSQSYDDIISDARKEIGTSLEDKPRSIRKIADDFYTQWVNRFAPVERASQQAKKQLKTKGASLRPENDPEYLVRRFTGAGGIASERFTNVLKPIIDELDARGIDKLDMDAYLKAKRDIGLAERNILGSDSKIASDRVVALMGKYPGIDEVAQKLYKYQNDGFQEMIDAGFLSKEAGDIIRQQNPDYVPFQRVMDELDNYLGVPSNKLQQGTQPIQKIKGSKRQIESPIESVIANTFKQRAAIEKNRVAQSIVDLQKVAPELGFEQMKKSSPETITVWRNGQKEYWKVGTDIADTAKAVNEESMNTLLKIFQAPASLLRQGATGRNPDFLIPNIIKDQFDAGISSKYGYIPFVDYVSGLRSMLGNDEMYQKWANSGAKIDLGELSGRKSIKQSFDQATKRKGLFGWLGSGLDVLGKYSEVPTRVGLFKKAYKKTGNELIAAMESRDATVDFARMGSKMKVANSVVPFLNVGVQGFDKIIRQAKNNPGKLALNAGIYAALPAITTTIYNLTNHAQEYAEIPQYVKDSNFVLVSGRNEDGTVDYFTIPKGNIAPLITNPIENFLTYVAGQNEQTLSEFTTQFISSALPVLGDGSSIKEVATKTIGQNLPQLIKPPIEGLLNRSFYKYDPNKEQSKEIVPEYLKKKEPYQQAYEWTPKTYKAIGAALNVSPLTVQHYLESYLAGYTKVPSQIVGILDNASQGKELRKNDIPILRRFMSTTFPSSGVKKVDKGEPIKTPFWERVTGKTSAKEITPYTVITQQLRDNIKERIKYGNEVSDSELTAAYLQPTIQMPKSNRYEKSQRDSELWSKTGTILSDENLSDAQKQALTTKIATELGVTKEEVEIYQVAKQDNNPKTLYVLDQIDKMQSNEELLNYLVKGRKPVNGKILISDGVIDNLVNDGLIPEQLGKDLKKLDFNADGTPKKKKTSSKGGSKKDPYATALKKYLDNLSNIKLSSGQIRTQAPIRIKTKGLTFEG